MSKKQKKLNAKLDEKQAQKQDAISQGVVAQGENGNSVQNTQGSQAGTQTTGAQASKQSANASNAAKAAKAEKAEKNGANDKNKADKKNKKNDKKAKKENGGLVKKTKETVSELKKVTWPTFGEVVKKTGIVIAFVLIFGVFLFGINTVLGGLVNLMMGLPFWS